MGLWSNLSALCAALLLATSPCPAMQTERHGDQLVLSGDVVAGDAEQVRRELGVAPGITTVILRNSHGGSAKEGYAVAELIRGMRLRTAVSGYCISACSRMFLGGVVRAFTDDYPAELTRVGFHGHYDRDGRLDPAAVDRLGLRSWILRHTDGKADPALVDRWVSLPNAGDAAYFMPAPVADRAGTSVFLCAGTASAGPVLGCEPIRTSAIEMGIATTDVPLHSNDAAEVRSVARGPAPSSFAPIGNVEQVPVNSGGGRAEYEKFLASPLPRAFAIAPDGAHWAWRGGEGDALQDAYRSCAERAGLPCQLYAVDDAVVWRTP